ncbi:integrase [Pandoraea apista]|nr:integrase [Pandoraea apista]RRW96837.1 integrase [Pandoraea apista]
MTMPTALPAGVHLRGATYHLRIKLPDDIRPLWPRRSNGSLAVDAYRASLKTSNRDEAAERAHAIHAEYRNRFAVLRAKAAPAPFVTITPALAAQFANEVRRRILRAEENTTFYSSGSVKQIARDAFAMFRAKAVAAMRDGDLSIAQQHAETIAKAWGLRVDWSAPDGKSCLISIVRSLVGAWRDVERRDQGEPIDTPEVIAPPGPSGSSAPKVLKLSEVIPSWINRNSPSEDSIRRTRRAVSLFEAVSEGVGVRDITKATGARFVAYLLDPARGYVRKTAYNIASAVTAVVNVAVRDDLIERNPMDLTFDKTIGAKQREPWTDDELRRMFSSPLFSDRMAEVPSWVNVTPEDGRALLLLLLHTGARLGEVGQLRCEDFVTRSGLLCVRFTAEAGPLKTADSERTVPLPANLTGDAWFADWVERLSGRAGHALPTLNDRNKGPSDIGARWFAKFREVTGLPAGTLKGSHRFRHWLRTALAEAGVNAETADAITGHAATGSSGRRIYTAAASLPTMVEALNRVKWPG